MSEEKTTGLVGIWTPDKDTEAQLKKELKIMSAVLSMRNYEVILAGIEELNKKVKIKK